MGRGKRNHAHLATLAPPQQPRSTVPPIATADYRDRGAFSSGAHCTARASKVSDPVPRCSRSFTPAPKKREAVREPAGRA